MKTPLLIDVPKDSPSKAEKIKAFKAQHEIETHDAPCNGDTRWVAAHMPSCRKLGYGVTENSTMFECVMHVGRLMDEGGLTGYGKSEIAAVRELCSNLKIPCDL